MHTSSRMSLFMVLSLISYLSRLSAASIATRALQFCTGAARSGFSSTAILYQSRAELLQQHLKQVAASLWKGYLACQPIIRVVEKSGSPNIPRTGAWLLCPLQGQDAG